MIYSKMKLAVLTIALAVLPLSLSAMQPEAKTYSWKWRYKAGEVWKEKSHIGVSGQVKVLGLGVSGQVYIDSVESNKIIALLADGDAALRVQLLSQKSTYNGTENQKNDDVGKFFDGHVTPQGIYRRNMDSHGSTSPGDVPKLSGHLSNRPIPTEPVKIGESWITQVDNLYLPGKKVDFVSTLTEVRELVGSEILQVEYKVAYPKKDGAEGDELVKITGSYSFYPSSSQLISEEINIENVYVSIPTQAELARLDLLMKVKFDYKLGKSAPTTKKKTKSRKDRG